MKAKYLKPLPVIGNHYHFWDDGKTNPGRHYICRCERIITSEEAKSIMIEIPNYYDNDVMDTISLYEHWHNNEMPEYEIKIRHQSVVVWLCNLMPMYPF